MTYRKSLTVASFAVIVALLGVVASNAQIAVLRAGPEGTSKGMRDVADMVALYGDTNGVRQAAELGNASAQFTMGAVYWTGFEVAEDVGEAATWLDKAAQQGHPKAQFFLGLAYMAGLGVPQDHVESLKWFLLSSQDGCGEDRRPCDLRDDMSKALTPENVADSYQRARAWTEAFEKQKR